MNEGEDSETYKQILSYFTLKGAIVADFTPAIMA